MGNLRMHADQISYKGGEKPMSVEEAIKNAGNTGLAHTADIAPDFSTESEYRTGDYVYHNGTLYVFTSNHAAGAWSASDTQAVTVGYELSSLMSGLNGLIVAEDRQLSFVNGKCEVSIPSDYILIAAIAGATLDFVAGFTLISGPTDYALFLKDTATLDRMVRLVYASKYIVIST